MQFRVNSALVLVVNLNYVNLTLFLSPCQKLSTNIYYIACFLHSISQSLFYILVSTSCFCSLAKPTAVLLTSKGDSFVFQQSEKATFTCEAACYPYPKVVELRVGSKVIDSTTPGVSDYKVDITSSNVRRHTAKFTVARISGN